MKRIFFLIFATILLASCSSASKLNRADQPFAYEVESVGVGADGTYAIRIWSFSKKPEITMVKPQQNAIHATLFKGIPAGGGATAQPALVPSDSQYNHDSPFFQEFFKSEIGDYKKEARFRSNVVIYRHELAITICEESDGNGAGDKIIAAKAAEGLIEVRGIKAAFAIVTVGDTMHISARSAGEINVQLILERLRGGGHFDTAGAQLKGVTAEEAVQQLKCAIDDYFEQMKLENVKDGKNTADK